MSKVVLVSRIFVGLIFTVFGLNGFLQFIPQPPLPEGAMAFMGGLASTGYFFPVLKITEILAGVLLLSGRFVPLALLVLAPIVLQINLFHILVAPDLMGTGMGLLLGAAGLVVAKGYGSSFSGVLKMNAKPD